jgi:hypothetical protein
MKHPFNVGEGRLIWFTDKEIEKLKTYEQFKGE